MKIPPFNPIDNYDDIEYPIIANSGLNDLNKNEELKNSLINEIFQYIADLQQAALQLKMNHWLTTSFVEHKNTDVLVNVLYITADAIAESAIGEFQRPKIKTYNSTVTDISSTSTKWVLDVLSIKTDELISTLKESGHEGLLSIVAEFDAQLKKSIYLSTLS